MSAETFENELRRFVHARPFQPFNILMEDGRNVLVDVPKAAINSGGAGVFDRAGEIYLIDCEDVREFRLASEELAR
jgi:hypothetical protein